MGGPGPREESLHWFWVGVHQNKDPYGFMTRGNHGHKISSKPRSASYPIILDGHPPPRRPLASGSVSPGEATTTTALHPKAATYQSEAGDRWE